MYRRKNVSTRNCSTSCSVGGSGTAGSFTGGSLAGGSFSGGSSSGGGSLIGTCAGLGASFDHGPNIATDPRDRISGGPVISHSAYRSAMTRNSATYRARIHLPVTGSMYRNG